MFDDLTDRQQEVLLSIAHSLLENHYPPSFREICRDTGIASTSTVSKAINALVAEGYLRMEAGQSRTLQLVEDKMEEYLPASEDRLEAEAQKEKAQRDETEAFREDVLDIPVFGNVAAGLPIYADDYVEETIPLPTQFFHRDGGEYFVLKIHGESMIEAGIFDGDYVLVRKQNYANDGDQIVALIEDGATVKTFFRFPDHVELRPENAAMAPIIVQDCTILGRVCGLYRIY